MYSADGGRLITRDPTGKTLHLPGQDLKVSSAGTSVLAATRTYTWGGVAIGLRVAGPTGLRWLSSDRQGSLNTVIGSTGTQEVAARYQDPYGNQRGSLGTTPSQLTRGYLGGLHDIGGLVHLGAREYDRFLHRLRCTRISLNSRG